MKFYVYVLVDPRTGEWRYVGRTKNLGSRLSVHMTARFENKRKTAWIDELRAAGLRPRLMVVCECDSVLDAAAAESGITAAARRRGEPLLNGKGERSHVGGTGEMCATKIYPKKYRSIRDLRSRLDSAL